MNFESLINFIWLAGRFSFNRADILPKKYTNGGLRLKADRNRHNTEENAGIGGLNDDDAHATRPDYARRPVSTAVQYPAQLRRDATRVNEVFVFYYLLVLYCLTSPR
jgi:hypothetical protein